MSIEKERDRMILFLPAVILSLFGRLNPNRKKKENIACSEVRPGVRNPNSLNRCCNNSIDRGNFRLELASAYGFRTEKEDECRACKGYQSLSIKLIQNIILLYSSFFISTWHYARVDEPSNSNCTGIIGATQMYVAFPIVSGTDGVMPQTYYIVPCINE
jgi:hypothetical protein